MFEFSHVVTLGELLVAIALVILAIAVVWARYDTRKRHDLMAVEKHQLHANREASRLLVRQTNIGNRITRSLRRTLADSFFSPEEYIHSKDAGVSGYDISVQLDASEQLTINISLFRSAEHAILVGCKRDTLAGWYGRDDKTIDNLMTSIYGYIREKAV